MTNPEMILAVFFSASTAFLNTSISTRISIRHTTVTVSSKFTLFPDLLCLRFLLKGIYHVKFGQGLKTIGWCGLVLPRYI